MIATLTSILACRTNMICATGRYKLSVRGETACISGRHALRAFRAPVFAAAAALVSTLDAGPAVAQGFSHECRANERISRIVVRTGLDDRFQFLGIECRRANGTRRILKAGIERGQRHEVLFPSDLRQIRFSKGSCRNDNTATFARICAVSFHRADGTGTSDTGAGLVTGSHQTLDGNGEIYGIAGVFRKGDSDLASGFSDLKIVTRKLEAFSDPTFDIRGVLETIQAAMVGSMGYAAVIRDPAGRRVGFVRSGWAIHPLDTSLARHAGQFDVHTMGAVGSTSKVWASAVAALRVDEFTQADTLGTPFATYLPRRWRDEVHPRFEDALVSHVIRHRAGFRRNGPSALATGGTAPARFRLRTGETWPNAQDTGCESPGCNALPAGTDAPYRRSYSNSAGGMFHIILPHMMLASVSGAPRMEDELAGLPDAAYDREIMAFAGRFYEDFVEEHILAPVGATATCDTRKFLGIRQVAAVYGDGRSDRTGILPASSTGNCAAGGWVISADDLSRIVSALRRDGILEPLSRARLLNLGPTRIWDATTQGDTTQHHSHNGDHDGMRAVILMRSEGHAVALIYNTRLGNNFLDQQMLVDAFDANRR